MVAPVVANPFVAKPQVNEVVPAPNTLRLLGYHYKTGERTYIAQTRNSGLVVKAYTVEQRKLYSNSEQATKINVIRRERHLPLITIEAVYDN